MYMAGGGELPSFIGEAISGEAYDLDFWWVHHPRVSKTGSMTPVRLHAGSY